MKLFVNITVLRRYDMCSFDVRQSYLQTAAMLTRVVYVRPCREIGDPGCFLLCLWKVLYGLYDSADYFDDTMAGVLNTEVGLRIARWVPALYHGVGGPMFCDGGTSFRPRG